MELVCTVCGETCTTEMHLPVKRVRGRGDVTVCFDGKTVFLHESETK